MGARRAKDERGFTVIETAISMTVLAVALLSMWSTIMYCSRSNLAAEQKRRAIEAAQAKIEEMKSNSFSALINTYGPEGKTGNRFPVLSLDDSDGAEGRITFLVDETQPVGGGAKAAPMDLNGDGDMADTDVSAEFALLPVRVTVTWNGPLGEQSIALTSVLAREQ